MYIARHKYILDIYMYTHQQNLIHTKLIRDFFVSNDFKKKEAEPPAFGPYLSVLLFGGGRVKELLHVSHEEQHAIRKEGEEGHEKGAVFLFLVEDLLRWRQAIPRGRSGELRGYGCDGAILEGGGGLGFSTQKRL